MLGLMIVNTSVGIMQLTKKWADSHGLTMKKKAFEYIFGMNGITTQILGTTGISMLLTPTLEVDVANVALILGDLYQGLSGCGVLCGHNEALGTATAALPGPHQQAIVTWPQHKIGCISAAQMEL